jgi:hypothetical protein
MALGYKAHLEKMVLVGVAVVGVALKVVLKLAYGGITMAPVLVVVAVAKEDKVELGHLADLVEVLLLEYIPTITAQPANLKIAAFCLVSKGWVGWVGHLEAMAVLEEMEDKVFLQIVI